MDSISEMECLQGHAAALPNTCQELLKSVGEDTIKAISDDILTLFESLPGIYESGACALGIFASRWCVLQGNKSPGYNQGLSEIGDWADQESCCAVAKRATETGKEIDAQCRAGIRLHANPIFAGETITGSIIFAYPDISQKSDSAEFTDNLPEFQFILDVAIKRLRTAAKLLGRLVERRQIERALQRDHEALKQRMEYRSAELDSIKMRLRHLYEKAPAMLHSMNRHGYILDVTDYWLETMGYERKDVIGKNVTSFMAEDSRTKLLEVDFPKLLETGFLKDVEYGIVKSNGETLFAIFSAIAQYDSQGKINHITSIYTDISDRKRIEDIDKRKTDLLEALQIAQLQFMSNVELRILFSTLLENLVTLTESEFGFIGEILYTEEGKPYLKDHAITNVAWDEKTRRLYDKYFSEGLEFRELENLFGEVILSGKPVFSNDPGNDPRSGGVPEGHPLITSFVGLPFHFSGQLVGMAGLANRPNGYDQGISDFLKPYLTTCATIIHAYRLQDEHRKADEQIQKSEARFRQIFTKNRAVKLLIQPKTGEIVDANSAAADFYGYSLAELKTIKIADITPLPEDQIRELMHKVESEEQMNSVLQQRLRSGDVRDVEIYSTPLQVDNKKLLYSIIHDVTDRIKAEKQLKESEERFRSVFMGATDFIYIKDSKLRFIAVNPAFESFVDKAASEILGRRAEDLFDKDTARHCEDSETHVLQGHSMEKELTITVNESSMTISCSMEPLRDADGNVIGVFGIARDVTGRRQISFLGQEKLQYSSTAMQSALLKATIAAKANATILLLGESGSGKDHLAHYIHRNSDRANGPYFAINCAAIAPQLAESELFGHEKGAFTGAYGRKRGLLELAEGGTLLLNEIGELSLTLQAKLLTFLDTRKFTRVGGEKVVSVNTRLIAATNKNLQEEVRKGRFRQDLFYRINVMPIEVPPLRNRREDIPVIVEEIMAKLLLDLRLTEYPLWIRPPRKPSRGMIGRAT